MAALLEQPSEVTIVDGQIIVDGPGHVAFTMTPAAAAETSDRMFIAAVEAGGRMSPIVADDQ